MARLKRIFEFIRDYSGVVAGLCGIGMTISIVIDVIGRNINMPIYWVTDISLILIVWLTFLAMGSTQAVRGHIRADFFITRFSPRGRAWFEAISWFFSFLFCLILFIAGVVSAVESVKMWEGSIGIVHFPIWPARIILAFGMLIICMQFIIDIIQELKRIILSQKILSQKAGQE